MKNHPGKTMTIYDIPSVIKASLPSAISPQNIMSGFSVSGIHPFNRNIFTETDFAPSYVTDRPEFDEQSVLQNEQTVNTTTGRLTVTLDRPEFDQQSILQQEQSIHILTGEPIVTPVNDNVIVTISNDENVELECRTPSPTPGTSRSHPSKSINPPPVPNKPTPETIRPFPKAPQKKTTLNRRKRSSAILTDTPVKNLLEEEQKLRKAKKVKPKKPIKKAKSTKKQKQVSSDDDNEDEEETLCLVCYEDWSSSKPNEEWVQCTKCRLWAHDTCAGKKDLFYSCPNCESDNGSEASGDV